MPFGMLVKSLFPARDIIHHRPKNHTMLHRKPPFRVEDACTPVAVNMGCVAEHGRWADATGISKGLLALPCFDDHGTHECGSLLAANGRCLVFHASRSPPKRARQEPFRQCGETSIRSPSRCSCFTYYITPQWEGIDLIERACLSLPRLAQNLIHSMLADCEQLQEQ